MWAYNISSLNQFEKYSRDDSQSCSTEISSIIRMGHMNSCSFIDKKIKSELSNDLHQVIQSFNVKVLKVNWISDSLCLFQYLSQYNMPLI